MFERRIPPAGDPFTSAAARPSTEDHDGTVEVHYSGLERLDRPHACLNGYVYIGHLTEGEDGEEVEVFEAVPCRRCSR